jgi:hypothetical protein
MHVVDGKEIFSVASVVSGDIEVDIICPQLIVGELLRSNNTFLSP